MTGISEQFKRNPMILGAFVVVVIVFSFGAYSIFGGGDETRGKRIEVTNHAREQVAGGLVTKGDEDGKRIVQQLPVSQVAHDQQKDALQNQGRYASPIEEPPPVVKQVKPVVVQPAQTVRTKNPKEDETRKLFEKFAKLEAKDGGFLKQASFDGEGNGNGNGPESAPVKPPFEIPYYVFVRGTVETGFNSLNTEVPVVITVTDARFPSQTKVIGTTKPNLDIGRMETELKQMRMRDGRRYKVSGLAYSMDETPGIASKVERRDITGAVISTVFAGVRGFAEAFSDDTSTTIIGPWGGATIERNKAENRMREAMLGASREGATKAETLVDRELEKDAFKTVVYAEKGLPVLVMFTQE